MNKSTINTVLMLRRDAVIKPFVETTHSTHDRPWTREQVGIDVLRAPIYRGAWTNGQG